MDYIKIINTWNEKRLQEPITAHNFDSYLVDLFNLLQKHGMTRNDLTEELCTAIIKNIEIDGLLSSYSYRFQTIVIYYVDYYADLLLNKSEIVEDEPIVEEDCEMSESELIDIDPDELPDEKKDVEFLKQLGVEIK